MEPSRYDPGSPVEPPPVHCHACGDQVDPGDVSELDGRRFCELCASELVDLEGERADIRAVNQRMEQSR